MKILWPLLAIQLQIFILHALPVNNDQQNSVGKNAVEKILSTANISVYKSFDPSTNEDVYQIVIVSEMGKDHRKRMAIDETKKLGVNGNGYKLPVLNKQKKPDKIEVTTHIQKIPPRRKKNDRDYLDIIDDTLSEAADSI